MKNQDYPVDVIKFIEESIKKLRSSQGISTIFARGLGKTKFLKQIIELTNFLDISNSKLKRIKITERLYYILNNLHTRVLCKECLIKNVSFNTLKNGYSLYCSNNCVGKSETIKSKRVKTFLKNYGVRNPQQCKRINNKNVNTCLARYGVRNANLLKSTREKIKNTCLKIYGTNCPAQSKIIKEKQKRSCLEKFGVENPYQSKEIKEKIRQTTLKRYNVEFFTKTKEYKNKREKTWIKNYNVSHPMQNAQIKEKQEKTNKLSAFKLYDVKLPSGDIRRVQGYERFVIPILLEKGYAEENIITGAKNIEKYIGKIFYTYKKRKCRYYPDIYIKSENKVIEVKSEWTYKKDLEINIKKRKAIIKNKINFEFWIYVNKENLIIK